LKSKVEKLNELEEKPPSWIFTSLHWLKSDGKNLSELVKNAKTEEDLEKALEPYAFEIEIENCLIESYTATEGLAIALLEYELDKELKKNREKISI
jgi:hypothetical protein